MLGSLDQRKIGTAAGFLSAATNNGQRGSSRGEGQSLPGNHGGLVLMEGDRVADLGLGPDGRSPRLQSSMADGDCKGFHSGFPVLEFDFGEWVLLFGVDGWSLIMSDVYVD